jgi:NitT/TauT family transport system substrate-binding protein
MSKAIKRFLVVAGIFVAAAGVFLLARKSIIRRPSSLSKLDRPLVVGLTSWPGYAGGIVANGGFQANEDSIFFKKYGLKVKFVLIEDVDARGKAFAKGGPDGLDIAWSTVDFLANEGPNLIKNGIHPRAIVQVDWSQGGDAIVAADNIHSVQDLKGKKISLVQFTPSNWLLENVLQSSGLTPEDQASIRSNLVFAQDITAARQAFITNQVDAVVVWEPEVSQALKRRAGSHVLTSTATYKNLIADVMLAKEEFVQSHPEAIEAFIRGWFDGVAEAREHPETAVRLLMQDELLFRDLGPDITRQSLNWVKLTDLDDNKQMFGLDGSPPLFDNLFSRAAQTWLERGFISSKVPPADVKDDRSLRLIYAKH